MTSQQLQYAALGYQRPAPALHNKQSERSNNWRNFSEGAVPRVHSPPRQQQQMHGYNQAGGNNNADMQMYQLQQTQMALQLEALKLQNLEMQERLMAAMNNPYEHQQPVMQQQPQTRSRPTSLISEQNFSQVRNDEQQTRRGALVNLQRASQNRRSSDHFSDGIPSPVQTSFPSNRLSFTGGDGLAERAMARKAAQQQAQQVEADFRRTHTRASSSLSSSGSPLLSENHKHFSSPAGPTLVLSQPGDEFPSPTLGKGPRGPPKRLSVSVSRPLDSDSTSSSPRTPDSEQSEVQSFESVTSFASSSDGGLGLSSSHEGAKEKPRVSLGLGRLNPSASSFSPALAAPFAPRTYVPRNFSAPPAMQGGVLKSKPMRQPRGPCADEELATKNFAGMVRRRSVAFLRSGRSSPAPPSPTGATLPLP